MGLRFIYKTFLKGLMAILPVAMTLYLFIWLIGALEKVFGELLKVLLPDSLYIPGLGLFVGLGVVFATGIILQTWFVGSFLKWVEKVFIKLPIIGHTYNALKQFTEYFKTDRTKTASKVVMYKPDNTNLELMGLVTVEDLSDAPDGVKSTKNIAVYLPMSYMVGGYTIYVPRDRITPVDMKTSDSLQWTLTAGVSGSSSENKQK